MNSYLDLCSLAPGMHTFFGTVTFELHPRLILTFVVSNHSLHNSSAFEISNLRSIKVSSVCYVDFQQLVDCVTNESQPPVPLTVSQFVCV